MMKTVTMHQPNYLPWLGFFSKIKHADCFVIYDIVEYPDASVINRNKIRIPDGWLYLTVPIGRKRHGARICDVKLPGDNKWKETHWNIIKHNYTKAEFFNLYQDFFEKLYREDFEYLARLNEEIILYLFKCFKINVEVIKASELNISPELRKTDLMIAVLKSVGAEIYLSGPTGRDYLELEKFVQNNIELKFFNFQHPVYQQRYPGFEPAMSAIDLLFNVGAPASDIIKASGSVEG